MSLAEEAGIRFEQLFGASPEARYLAPGRINLIGEHTDYNDGFVLPAAIEFATVAIASPRTDNEIHVVAIDQGQEQVTIPATGNIPAETLPVWARYILGVIQGLGELGTVRGANLAVSGNVPMGAGLSSSASLEIACGSAIADLSGITASGEQLARIGQLAEHHCVGTLCGIMDQLVSAVAEPGHASLIDCRSLNVNQVPLPTDLEIVIVHSNVQRGLVDSAYNERRKACESAAAQLGVDALRDVAIEDMQGALAQLPTAIRSRARHVISENDRTLRAADALRENDIATLSGLMAESHRSMAADFEITVPPIDLIVRTVDGVLGEAGGVRMTGGGFGGCVVALAPPALVPEIRDALKSVYEPATGLMETVWVSKAMAGVSKL